MYAVVCAYSSNITALRLALEAIVYNTSNFFFLRGKNVEYAKLTVLSEPLLFSVQKHSFQSNISISFE